MRVQPSGTNRDESVLDARMRGQPVADRATAVAGESIRDAVEITAGIGTVKGVEQCEIARGGARRRGLGARVAVPDRPRALDPDFVGASVVVQGHFDPVAVHRPARGGWEVAGRHGAEFVAAEDRCACERRDHGGSAAPTPTTDRAERPFP
jgi:hypothetical protein